MRHSAKPEEVRIVLHYTRSGERGHSGPESDTLHAGYQSSNRTFCGNRCYGVNWYPSRLPFTNLRWNHHQESKVRRIIKCSRCERKLTSLGVFDNVSS